MLKQKIKATLLTTLAIGSIGYTTGSIAQNLNMPNHAVSTIELPARGLTKEQVRKRFGEPDDIRGPIGQPPIYYWDYPDFTVYFESDYVIHAVNKHQTGIKK